MSEKRIAYSPVRDQWVLSDGRHWMEVPGWARDIVRDEAERETKSLQAENAKLREELTASTQCETCEAMLDCDECLRANESVKERKRLDYENAKLRELVKEAHLCMVNEGCCEDCYATHGECPIERDMRELGIGVKGCTTR